MPFSFPALLLCRGDLTRPRYAHTQGVLTSVSACTGLASGQASTLLSHPRQGACLGIVTFHMGHPHGGTTPLQRHATFTRIKRFARASALDFTVLGSRVLVNPPRPLVPGQPRQAHVARRFNICVCRGLLVSTSGTFTPWLFKMPLVDTLLYVLFYDASGSNIDLRALFGKSAYPSADRSLTLSQIGETTPCLASTERTRNSRVAPTASSGGVGGLTAGGRQEAAALSAHTGARSEPTSGVAALCLDVSSFCFCAVSRREPAKHSVNWFSHLEGGRCCLFSLRVRS